VTDATDWTARHTAHHHNTTVQRRHAVIPVSRNEIILIKRLARSLCDPLAFIFQASFRSHVLPASWLHAIINHVFRIDLTSSALSTHIA